MPDLWNKDKEIEFFTEAQNFASPEKLFYQGDDLKYYAYWPKSYKGKKPSVLQSRNALIGNFTEKFTVNLLTEFAALNNCYAIQGVVCEEIGLTKQSPADVALCTTINVDQDVDNIKAIFEVKMSIVWNWELSDNELICLGDYTKHKGNPGLLRSDSMLKAIGKCINIRVSGTKSSQIPIIVLGNTPISKSYVSKVDHLRNCGIIQGFWSINPRPVDSYNANNIKNSVAEGFIRIDTYNELKNYLDNLLIEEHEFFSSMKSKEELGKIISISNDEPTFVLKAEKFLDLIR